MDQWHPGLWNELNEQSEFEPCTCFFKVPVVTFPEKLCLHSNQDRLVIALKFKRLKKPLPIIPIAAEYA